MGVPLLEMEIAILYEALNNLNLLCLHDKITKMSTLVPKRIHTSDRTSSKIVRVNTDQPNQLTLTLSFR
jgi:hypothetical protein